MTQAECRAAREPFADPRAVVRLPDVMEANRKLAEMLERAMARLMSNHDGKSDKHVRCPDCELVREWRGEGERG